MSYTDQFIVLLHADPETIEGVPTNADIIESDDGLKKSGVQDISDSVRSGFLQMWQTGYVRDKILGLTYPEIDQLYATVSKEMVDTTLSENLARDLRFIFNAVQSANNNKEIYRHDYSGRKLYMPHDNAKTPWGMPHDIFWGIVPVASVKRAQWVVDNRPWIPIEEVSRVFVLQPQEIEQLKQGEVVT